jgi:hypothetical protein
MTNRAERPITISFIEGSSCTFDSNDFVEFDILTHDLPMGEIVFIGNPFTDAGLTELGRCVYDYCDHGLYVYQELANMLYEAQHPWLDYEDAVEKKAFDEKKEYLCLVEDVDPSTFEGKGVFSHWLHFGNYLEEVYEWHGIRAVKPIKPFDFYHFNQVKVWQPPQ